MAARVPLLELERMPWSESMVARALIHSNLFQRKLLIVPRCHFVGAEADLLAVHTPSLRLLDIEIKISRADLLADPKKDKWWHRPSYHELVKRIGKADAIRTWGSDEHRTQREWPPKIWKHYYAMPAEIWHRGKESLEPKLPKASGVVLLQRGHDGVLRCHLARRAKGNKQAPSIQPADVMDLARLAGLRMWDALARLET